MLWSNRDRTAREVSYMNSAFVAFLSLLPVSLAFWGGTTSYDCLSPYSN